MKIYKEKMWVFLKENSKGLILLPLMGLIEVATEF
jgi:hypothetical protein